MAALNNVTTANGYTDANTLKCEGSNIQNLYITGAAVYVSYSEREMGFTGRAPAFSEDKFLPPGYYNWARKIEQIKFKSAVANVSAQVTVDAE